MAVIMDATFLADPLEMVQVVGAGTVALKDATKEALIQKFGKDAGQQIATDAECARWLAREEVQVINY